jgi:hypothetical protein
MSEKIEERIVFTKDDVRLNDDEFKQCLKRAEMGVFLDVKPVTDRKPKSVFVIAQPGAGKTGLHTYVENRHEQCNFIEFNPDLIAVYHARYPLIIEHFPDDSYELVQEFVRPALDGYLRQRAVQLKTDILQEGTFASPEYIRIIDFQKNGGYLNVNKSDGENINQTIYVNGDYDVELNVLAVHKYESLLSSYEREQYFIENEFAPRSVVEAHHDRAYCAIINNIRQVEKLNLSDEINVYRRGYTEKEPQLIYRSSNKRNYKSAVEAIESEREKNRIELLNNSEKYLTRISSLLDRVNKNKCEECKKSQIARITKLRDDFLKDLELYRSMENTKNNNKSGNPGESNAER